MSAAGSEEAAGESPNSSGYEVTPGSNIEDNIPPHKPQKTWRVPTVGAIPGKKSLLDPTPMSTSPPLPSSPNSQPQKLYHGSCSNSAVYPGMLSLLDPTSIQHLPIPLPPSNHPRNR